MKIFIKIIYLLALSTLLLNSCKEKESFPFKGADRINFGTNEIYYTFGTEAFSVHDKCLKIPVVVVGRKSEHDRSFAIEIDSEETTATKGKEFDDFPTNYNIKANEYKTEIPITIHRLKMSEEEVYKLVLKINAGKDFEEGIVENKKIVIAFTNRLDKPNWWNMLSEWLGEYNPKKYQKFIEFNGKPISKNDIYDNKYGILRIFKRVKIYFDEHPEFDVHFPDVDWPI